MEELLCTLDIVRLHLPSPYLYHARNLIERFFDRIKQLRRVVIRYDILAANNLA
jgi:transposase